mmetsp:Transcript_101350/g.182931  ORF Transcript_101350/g.182931 Transcript_101350/m.182931 type:complete len:92 (+) Transcript_101350:1-276(+)
MSLDGEQFMDFYHKYINPRHVGHEVTISLEQGAPFAVSGVWTRSRPMADYEPRLDTSSPDLVALKKFLIEYDIFMNKLKRTCSTRFSFERQ